MHWKKYPTIHHSVTAAVAVRGDSGWGYLTRMSQTVWGFKIQRAEPWYFLHDDVIKWKHFSRYWPFVRGIHRSPVNSPHKGQWRGALMFLWSAPWINGWANNREAGDLRRHRAHYDVIVMGNVQYLRWRYLTSICEYVRYVNKIEYIYIYIYISCSLRNFRHRLQWKFWKRQIPVQQVIKICQIDVFVSMM